MKKVEVIPYQAKWPLVYQQQADKIKQALNDNMVAIHHVGSTAVPGLDSKDKIDICLQVNDAAQAIFELERIGYIYSGEWNIPFKYGLTYRHDVKVNLHMFDFNHPVIEANLLFRDYLRNNEAIRREYAQLKYKILEAPDAQVKNNPLFYQYTLYKSPFIKKILRKLGFDKTYLQYCADSEEWNIIKGFRNKYFFKPNNIEDPYSWTFDHPDHKHFAFYKGADIIGYAHIQLWSKNRAAMRIIVIDEKYRGKGYGTELMKLIERWLKSLSIQSIHAESRQTSLRFYLNNGYTEMPFNDPACQATAEQEPKLENDESGTNDIPVGKLL